MRNVNVKWWHAVGGLFILFIGIPYLLGSAWYYLKADEDSTGARFSEAEKAQLRVLQPQLDSLVFSEEEIQGVPGGAFYDCTTPNNNAGVYYDTKDEESDAVDVTIAGRAGRHQGAGHPCARIRAEDQVGPRGGPCRSCGERL